MATCLWELDMCVHDQPPSRKNFLWSPSPAQNKTDCDQGERSLLYSAPALTFAPQGGLPGTIIIRL